jgi:carbon-monoxide dehydrogenase medium subunit
MLDTRYHRPASLSEAMALFSGAAEARYLSGGQTLIPTMKQRLAGPSDLIDIARLPELRGIAATAGGVTIGAAMTHAEVAASDVVRQAVPGLAALAGMIGDPAVRHRGTIGGSIANNDPAADYPAALLALDATVVTNKREIAAAKFFTGLFETALKDGEIVTAVKFTAPAKAGYEKFRNPASRYAMTGVFVAKGKANGKDDVRVAVTGAGEDGVYRSKEIEAALSKKFDASALEGVTVPSKKLMSDIHASSDYRAALVVVMAKRAVATANG